LQYIMKWEKLFLIYILPCQEWLQELCSYLHSLTSQNMLSHCITMPSSRGKVIYQSGGVNTKLQVKMGCYVGVHSVKILYFHHRSISSVLANCIWIYDSVVLEQVFLRMFPLSPLSIISQMVHSHV
jgi:hypothetical protein